MKVYLSELAEYKLIKLTEYLLEKWNLKVKNDFVSILTKKIDQIIFQPESCPKSKELNGLYKCVVTKPLFIIKSILKNKRLKSSRYLIQDKTQIRLKIK